MASLISQLRSKRLIESRLTKTESVLNIREGESAILTYTSATDKMKIFSAWFKEGLENGDLVDYTYPDEESETVRSALTKHGVDVNKYEKKGSLHMRSLTEYMSNGRFDKNKVVKDTLDLWSGLERKGYKHARMLADVADFSFLNGQWQIYLDYWNDPIWTESGWSFSGTDGMVFKPCIMDVTAINVGGMTEAQTTELLKAFGKGTISTVKFIDFLEDINSFSRSIGIDHKQLLGRKILLEFDPVSDYEEIIESLAREAMANVEPVFVFTSNTSTIRSRLTKYPAVKLISTSISTSTTQSPSENEIILPADNPALILDSLNKVLEAHSLANVCLVFGNLSELLISMGQEKTYVFLHHALNMLFPQTVTALFFLNSNAHEPRVVSYLRELFNNQLAYEKNRLTVTKIFR